MTRIIAGFASANAALARGFDRFLPYPPRHAGCLTPYELKVLFAEGKVIADVGGEKKPYAASTGFVTDGKSYIGFDLDPEELARAPFGIYSETRVMDICAPDPDFADRFDLIICRSTLEHVKDTTAAVSGLAAMLAPGGRCFVRLPCRKAMFARLNLLLPNEIKRRLMHAVFPHKVSDGFPAFYDMCLPSDIRGLAAEHELEVVAERRTYRSSYFGFFFPLYILWRGVASLQYLIDSDYCESFEMVLRKPPRVAPQ